MSDTYMENDPKSLEEARTMLLDSWQDIDKGKQAEKRRDELIVQAFALGASYTEVMVCTGLSRPTVWRIRRRAEQKGPTEDAGWDFTIPGHYSKTDVPQSILEDTLQDGFFGLLDDAAEDDDHHDRDFSSPDLNDQQKAIRDAVHDLAARAAVTKADFVASTALGITLTRHKQRQAPAQAMTSKDIREEVEDLQRIAGRDTYILANPSCLRFSYPAGETADYGHTITTVVREDDGILLYDTEFQEHVGFFPGDPDQHKQTQLLPCTNGRQYDDDEQEHPDAESLHEGAEGTCTVIGTVAEPAKDH